MASPPARSGLSARDVRLERLPPDSSRSEAPEDLRAKDKDAAWDADAPVGRRRDPFDIEAGEPSKPPKAAPKLAKVRLFNVWPTRSKFFCQGLLMTGGETEIGITPNLSVPNCCVWTCILAPCSVYFFHIVPHMLSQGVYAMPLATLMVFILATGSLLATCCSDPGIIPRREVILATGSGAQLEEALGYDTLAAEVDPKTPKTATVPRELALKGYRWCRTCRIIRPPRASHCPDCDNCVLRYDHHCPFVNNCVGQRNYHFFFAFITSVLCLAIMVLPVLFMTLNSDHFEASIASLTQLDTSLLQPVFYALIGIGTVIGLAALLGFVLWVYHLFLVLTNRTTKEYRRSVPNVNEEPTLCAARGPRLFDPWALVDPADLLRSDELPSKTRPVLCGDCFEND